MSATLGGMEISDLVFTGFNKRVAALERLSGSIVWEIKLPHYSSGYVTLLLDDDRLIASADGYMFAIDPMSGNILWENEMPGFGFGVASLVSVRGSAVSLGAAEACIDAERRRRASH